MESAKNEKFIEKARAIHGNRYDYSKVNYVNAKTKVTIVCEHHCEFEQTPCNHLSGFNCQKCAKNLRMDTNTFIERANSIHENKYDYSKVDYINADTKIIIGCKEHGEFEQIPDFHLNRKCGCPKCANNITLTNSEFTEKANKIHKNIYDYSQVDYVNNRIHVTIICKEHGQYSQTPTRHFAGDGCPHCVKVEEFFVSNKIEEKISIIKKKVFNNKTNLSLLTSKVKKCGLSTNNIGVPFLWDGATSKCLSGDVDIIKFFEDKISK